MIALYSAIRPLPISRIFDRRALALPDFTILLNLEDRDKFTDQCQLTGWRTPPIQAMNIARSEGWQRAKAQRTRKMGGIQWTARTTRHRYHRAQTCRTCPKESEERFQLITNTIDEVFYL
jgi:hypothetical protein